MLDHLTYTKIVKSKLNEIDETRDNKQFTLYNKD